MLVSLGRTCLVTYFISSPVAVSKTCSSFVWCRVLIIWLSYAAYVVGFINLKPEVLDVYVLEKKMLRKLCLPRWILTCFLVRVGDIWIWLTWGVSHDFRLDLQSPE